MFSLLWEKKEKVFELVQKIGVTYKQESIKVLFLQKIFGKWKSYYRTLYHYLPIFSFC